jgi:hypothetical protein
MLHGAESNLKVVVTFIFLFNFLYFRFNINKVFNELGCFITLTFTRDYLKVISDRDETGNFNWLELQ